VMADTRLAVGVLLSLRLNNLNFKYVYNQIRHHKIQSDLKTKIGYFELFLASCKPDLNIFINRSIFYKTFVYGNHFMFFSLKFIILLCNNL
jgi:hypothetical protein